jgi:acetyl/propionyl-CoA carboxylase alpha subunit
VALHISVDEGAPREVTLTRRENRDAVLWIDGKEHRALLRTAGAAYEICLDDHTEPIWLFVDGDSVFIHAFGRAWRTEVSDPSQRSLADANQADVATAPMPGMVISVGVSPGEAVIAGQPLLVIESMKMQSEIVAWRDGIVERVHLQVGDAFDRGAGLVELVALDQEVAVGAEPVSA